MFATRGSDAARWSPYASGLRRTSMATAAVAELAIAVELIVGPHRLLSLVFLVAGAAIGVAVGRGLARTLSDWADDAPVASGDELPATVDDQPSLPSVVLLCLVAVTSVYVPIQYHVPTPIPGGLAAIAVQAWLQGRAIEKVQRRRGGRVLRPGGRLSFDGAELRLLPETARESGSPQG